MIEKRQTTFGLLKAGQYFLDGNGRKHQKIDDESAYYINDNPRGANGTVTCWPSMTVWREVLVLGTNMITIPIEK